MILRGECGAFNPLLLECLLEIRDGLTCEESLETTDQQSMVEAIHVSERLMSSEKSIYRDHMLHVLRVEQVKNEFFQSLQESVQFDYDALTRTLTLSDWL